MGKKQGRPPTHGLSNTPTYRSWRNAKQRCENPNAPQYKDYGGRGIECRITVQELVDEIGIRPDGTSLDRIGPDGHYEIGNIRWATPKQQASNRRPPRPPEYYKKQAIKRIEANHQDWNENARWWNLSIKLINYGKLADIERKELEGFCPECRLPRTSFDLDELRDWVQPWAGKVRLPSLIHPRHSVRICCGPVGGMRHQKEIERGLLTSLGQVPLSYNSDKSHRKVIKHFLRHYENRSKMGLCFSAQDFAPERLHAPHQSPERLLLALASRLHLRKKWNVRFMTMSELSTVIEFGSSDELTGTCLIVPDFHVSGPRGFGIAPWFVNRLVDLLKKRISDDNPTVIYAEVPGNLSEKIDHIINCHYLKMPREV